MATVTKPIALDESFNTTELTPRNIADVLAQELSRITGRDASQVEYDNTDSGLTADNVQDALDEIAESVPTLPTTDIQTAVDEFSTYNGGLLSSLKVSLTPNQDLHGYSEPWVGGSKKNKFEVTATTATEQGVLFNINSDGTITTTRQSASSNNASIIMGDFTLPVGSYKINGANNASNGGYFTLRKASDNTFIANIESSGYDLNVSDATFEYRLTCVVQSSVSPTGDYTTVEPMIRLATESDPTFEPYSNICPISGHTQVVVGDEGKNLFDPSNVINGYIGQSDGVDKVISLANTRVIYAPCEPNTAYTVSKTIGKRFRVGWTDTLPDIGVTVYNAISDNTASNLTITAGATAKYIVAFVWFGTYDTITADEMLASCQIELGSTATAYVPYNGYQITVNLGGTYYSGTLDVVSGVLTVTQKSIGASDFDAFGQRSAGGLYYVQTDTTGSKQNGNGICNIAKVDNQNAWISTTPVVQISPAQAGRIRFYCESTSMNEFLSQYANLQIVFELDTPLTIQLSPTMVKALVGENHLSAPLDGQEITESKYKQMFTFDDVNAQIESTYSEGISHNSVYRGKYLGDHVTDEQWDAIGDGSFRDLYIGDYWAINGINWRIAHFNYWLGTGDVKCNTNHVVIVPYGWVSTFNMNATDDTTGGYLNSEWYTTNRHFAVENIEADFGASHILSHRNFFSDAVSDGHASHGMWVDSTVDLMNEIMVCGSLVGSYSGKYYEVGCDKFQLALFKYNPPSTRMDVSYWLRGVSTASSFVAMGNFGLLDGFTASQILKIRPVFAIKK